MLGRRHELGGFSLIELMIVVAMIGIIAAIAIPALLNARIRANEAGVLADSKVILSAQATYAAANFAFATDLRCLSDPPNCGAGNWPVGTAAFIDAQLGCLMASSCTVPPNVVQKSGYARTFTGGLPGAGRIEPGVSTFTYFSDPQTPNFTGTRFFTLDHTGLICHGSASFGSGGGLGNPAACSPI